MKTAYVIAGRLTPQGTLELDEPPPLAPGPVRVLVEPAGESEEPSLPADAEMSGRKARMEAAIGCLSDEETQHLLDVIQDEFERVDLDEWR